MESVTSLDHLQALRKFKLIDRNVYPLPHVKAKLDYDENMCNCDFPPQGAEDNRRCYDLTCLNFATQIECNPEDCPAGKYCENQRLQRRNFPVLEVIKVCDLI